MEQAKDKNLMGLPLFISENNKILRRKMYEHNSKIG